MHYLFLVISIIAEVIATTALKASASFSKLWPSLVVVFGYGIAFYCLSIALRKIPIGIAYAIWCGIGIVFISILGWVFYRQSLDAPAWIGIVLIMTGVVIINVFSRSVV
jgi:small multidrug resistance pump